MVVNPALIALAVVAVASFSVFVVAKVLGARQRQGSAGRVGVAISILPRTSLGWWSLGLAAAFVLALVAVALAPGDGLLDAESDQAVALALKVVFIVVAAASFVAGLISLIKRKESSVLVLLGMLGTLWLGLIGMVAHLFME